MAGFPEHVWRYPTREAIASLAKRFGLPDSPDMQDWEWEVADPRRIDEFLAAYRSGELDDDQRFTIMETILQSFEESRIDLGNDSRWQAVLTQLETHIELHGYSVWYWSDLESADPSDAWRVTPYMREILARHRRSLEAPA